MFGVLRHYMESVKDSKTLSLDDLEHVELNSVRSICLSETASNCTRLSIDLVNGDIEEYAKQKVLKIVKALQKLETRHIAVRDAKLQISEFLDMIRDHQYKHVSMSMLESFIKTFNISPKPYYLHYYIYFLYYASYYHSMRSSKDIIDKTKTQKHKSHFVCIQAQLKYIQHIINQSKARKVKT